MIHLVLAILFSLCMGLVIQRGGTCTVAAIQEILHKKTSNRIQALIETALWVLAGEILLSQLGIKTPLINHWQITPATVLGAFLLGLGAFVNGACAVGTIARIGNREWDFLMMLPGFFCGAAIIHWLNLPALQPISQGLTTTPHLSFWSEGLITILLFLRAYLLYRKGLQPYVLTVIIGIFFLALLTIDKAWSYTDLLVDVAKLNTDHITPRIFLFVALLCGAIVSGHFQDPVNHPLKKLTRNTPKRFVGGALMGAATLLIPGSHDSLVLLFMPLLLGYAWLSFLVMASTILVCKLLMKK